MHFHQNRTKIVENIHLDRQTDRQKDRQTDRQTDAQTGLILRVKIFSPEMTEYKKTCLTIGWKVLNGCNMSLELGGLNRKRRWSGLIG